MGPAWRRCIAVAIAHLAAAGSAAGARLGLRRLNDTRSKTVAGFDSLPQCEAAYKQLYDQCYPVGSRAPGSSGNRSGGGQDTKKSRITEQPQYAGGAAPEAPRAEPKPAVQAEPAKPRSPITKGEVGQAEQTESRPIYHAPKDRTGVAAEDGWDYREHGEDWAKLGMCSGPQQSPIDVAKFVDTQGQTKYLLWFDYYRDPDLDASKQTNIVNDGHGIRYDVHANSVDFGFVKIGKQEYEASEYQFHAPSEHTVDGAIFPLELQIYNKAKDGTGIVAIALFFREGKSNAFLKSLLDATGGKGPVWHPNQGTGVSVVSGKYLNAFDLQSVIPTADVAKEASFYNYEGSLTQPPCTQGVDWWVLAKPITATREEIKFIRKAIFSSDSTRHGNARETQPIGERRIFVGLSGWQHAVKQHRKIYKDADETKEARGYSSEDMPWGMHWGPKDGSEVTL